MLRQVLETLRGVERVECRYSALRLQFVPSLRQLRLGVPVVADLVVTQTVALHAPVSVLAGVLAVAVLPAVRARLLLVRAALASAAAVRASLQLVRAALRSQEATVVALALAFAPLQELALQLCNGRDVALVLVQRIFVDLIRLLVEVAGAVAPLVGVQLRVRVLASLQTHKRRMPTATARASTQVARLRHRLEDLFDVLHVESGFATSTRSLLRTCEHRLQLQPRELRPVQHHEDVETFGEVQALFPSLLRPNGEVAHIGLEIVAEVLCGNEALELPELLQTGIHTVVLLESIQHGFIRCLAVGNLQTLGSQFCTHK